MMPAFGLEGGAALALLRGLSVAALLQAFGSLVFLVLVAPRALARAPAGVAAGMDRRLVRLAWAGVAATAALMPGWLVLQARDMAGAQDLAGTLAAVPAVLTDTSFGHVLLSQLAALAASGAALRWGRRRWAAALFGVAAALQAGHGHALAMEDGPGLLLLAGVVHLLAAGAWLGGLLPLLVLVHGAPAKVGAAGARWFSPLGKWCVAGVAGSALVQGWMLVGGLPGLVGTAYGWVALAKLGLLGVLLGFAAANRYRLAPALLRAQPDAPRRTLVLAIGMQTGAGLLTVLAASTLGSLPPAMHEQPVWPFPLRPSLAVLTDPDLAREVSDAALLLAGALAIAMLGTVWRRLRWAALAAAAVVGWFALPSLGLLLVEAYPTSYYTSPSGFSTVSLARGAGLFPQTCAGCHGAGGRGDGPAAAGLPVPPADLTAAHLWEHSDGEMFWWLLHGVDRPGGGQSMPGTAGRLSDRDRWALIDWVRANNAGLAFQESGAWPHPVQAPGFALSCAGGRAMTTEDLRGSILHVVAAGDGLPSDPGPAGLVTVLLTRGAGPPPGGACAATDPAAWNVYATLAGVPPAALAGTGFLVDPQGWLRAVQRPGGQGTPRWSDPALLLIDAWAICAQPVAAPAGAGHVHP